MRRTSHPSRWLFVPILAAGLIALAAGQGHGQPPGGDRGDRGDRGSRGGFGGGTPDPDQIWGFMAQGKDTIDLNTNSRMKSSMERNGDPIPPNGILTKEAFKANYARRVAQGGGVGGRGGPPPAAPAATPAAPGQVAGGAPGSAEWVEGRFRESDLNKDGFISPDEASSKLKQTLPQYDKNGDGKLDLNEYKGYMAERFAGGPNGPGGFGQIQPIQQQPDYNAQFGGGSGRSQVKREEEDAARVSVSRFGKLPKEVPAFFTELDDDRDGMVGLYEWRRHGRKTADFVEMDLNADGYLTADEWLRYNRIAIEKRDQESLADKSPAERGVTASRGGSSSSGGDKSDKGDKGDDKGGKGGKGKDRGPKDKPNPFAPGR